MVISRFDSASQLRREPGRVINQKEVNFLRIISLLDLVVPSPTMKMILRKTGRMIASRAVMVVEDQVEETMAMGTEMEEATVIHHLPNHLIRAPRRIRGTHRKTKRGNGGGDDGVDPDKDSEDSDEKFVRRMKKFLGDGFNTGGIWG